MPLARLPVRWVVGLRLVLLSKLFCVHNRGLKLVLDLGVVYRYRITLFWLPTC